MTAAQLPSKDQLLQACAGVVSLDHPVLLASLELSNLHESRLKASTVDIPEIDCARTKLVHDIDRWMSSNGSDIVGASFLHTETVGMVIDRMAEYSVAARSALERDVGEPHLHYLWHRLSEISLAYTDLAFEIHAGRRKLPDFTEPWPTQNDSASALRS